MTKEDMTPLAREIYELSLDVLKDCGVDLRSMSKPYRAGLMENAQKRANKVEENKGSSEQEKRQTAKNQ